VGEIVGEERWFFLFVSLFSSCGLAQPGQVSHLPATVLAIFLPLIATMSDTTPELRIEN